MDASGRKRWLPRLIIVGVAYFVVGIAFGSFAGWSASNQMRVTWRLLAFLVSGVAFAIHIGYEHFRLLNSPRITASHAALAVSFTGKIEGINQDKALLKVKVAIYGRNKPIKLNFSDVENVSAS